MLDNMNSLRITKFEYFIVFLLIVMCGFTSGDIIPAKSYFLSIMCIIYLVKRKNNQEIKPLLTLIIGYWIIGIMHYIEYKYYSSKCIIDRPLLMLTGFYVIDKLNYRFKYAYMNIMTVIAGISLLFYSIMVLTGYVPSLSFLEKPYYKGVFIFNMRINEIADHRNCGPFWEPGAFAGYLLMVGLMFFNQLDILWREYKKKCVILLLALFSTLSSQGYLALGLLILLYYLRSHFNLKTILAIFGFGIIAYFSYIQFDFLREKVNDQLELAADWESNESLQSANRFSTTLLDIYYIEKSPIIGNTDNLQIRYADHPFILRTIDNKGSYGSGSGTSSAMASYGIPLFILWLYLTFKAFNRSYSRREAIFSLLFIVILGSAEAYNGYILYLSFPFLILGNKKGVNIIRHGKNKHYNCNI